MPAKAGTQETHDREKIVAISLGSMPCDRFDKHCGNRASKLRLIEKMNAAWNETALG
jgi:hypothetical protein